MLNNSRSYQRNHNHACAWVKNISHTFELTYSRYEKRAVVLRGEQFWRDRACKGRAKWTFSVRPDVHAVAVRREQFWRDRCHKNFVPPPHPPGHSCPLSGSVIQGPSEAKFFGSTGRVRTVQREHIFTAGLIIRQVLYICHGPCAYSFLIPKGPKQI